MNKAERRRRLARTFEKYIRLGLYDTSLDVFDICQRIRMSCVSAGSARDLFAVWELIRMLRAEGKREELRYFVRYIILRQGPKCTAAVSRTRS